jgi:hypothetical protein
MRLPVLLATAVLLIAAAPPPRAIPAGTPVALAAHAGTALDATARQLVADDLAESRRAGERPLVLVGSAPLGTASDRPAVFVQLQSARQCGSAGCSTSAFLWRRGAWKRVLDGVGGKLSMLPSHTRGMADLTTGTARYVWTGQEYRDSQPSPAIDLRPRRRH